MHLLGKKNVANYFDSYDHFDLFDHFNSFKFCPRCEYDIDVKLKEENWNNVGSIPILERWEHNYCS